MDSAAAGLAEMCGDFHFPDFPEKHPAADRVLKARLPLWLAALRYDDLLPILFRCCCGFSLRVFRFHQASAARRRDPVRRPGHDR